MKAIGIVLIVFGMLSGVSTASLNMKNEAQKMPQAERFGQAVGGALCSLTLVGGGVLLAWMAGRKPVEGGYRRPEKGRDDDPKAKNPWDSGPA